MVAGRRPAKPRPSSAPAHLAPPQAWRPAAALQNPGLRLPPVHLATPLAWWPAAALQNPGLRLRPSHLALGPPATPGPQIAFPHRQLRRPCKARPALFQGAVVCFEARVPGVVRHGSRRSMAHAPAVPVRPVRQARLLRARCRPVRLLRVRLGEPCARCSPPTSLGPQNRALRLAPMVPWGPRQPRAESRPTAQGHGGTRPRPQDAPIAPIVPTVPMPGGHAAPYAVARGAGSCPASAAPPSDAPVPASAPPRRAPAPMPAPGLTRRRGRVGA
jgi:hypothetical protein